MKNILLGIGALIIAIVAGLYFYVANMDWNDHKGRMVEQVMTTTGKKIVFDGKVNFSLLPSPYLEAKNVKLYNREGTSLLAEIPSMVAELKLFPLLGGSLQVTSMSLQNPKLIFNISENGKLNWSEESRIDEYSPKAERLEFSSVMLKDAEIKIDDKVNEYDVSLKGVSGEFSAEGIDGPYRLEGNFVRGKETFGFVFSLGAKTEGYATPVSFAVIHAPTESYIRFDGTGVLENNALNGNVLLESKDPLLILSMFDENLVFDVDKKESLTISTEIKTNKSRLDLANFVLKYGQNIGAGNIIIPLAKTVGVAQNRRKPKIEAVFEMTDLDLDTLKLFAKDKVMEIWNTKEAFIPNLKYDLVFDLKSIKTLYNAYELQNFVTSFEIVNNILVIKTLSALAPGNTRLAARGRLFSENEKPSYNLDFALITDDFQKMANWLGYNPNVIVPATYKNAQFAMNISGTPNNAKFSPLKIVFDKINVEADVSYLSDDRKTWSITAKTDNVINFDNYAAALPENYINENVKDKLLHRFEELGFLNDMDLFIDFKLPGFILDKVAYGETAVAAELISGKMELKNFELKNFYDAIITADGMISGFGDSPVFEKLNYTFDVDDFQTFAEKIGNKDLLSGIDKNGKISSRGMLNGKLDQLTFKTITSFAEVDFIYDGMITTAKNEEKSFAGEFSLKAPDFAKFMDEFFGDKKYEFLPKSLFSFESGIEGKYDDFKLSGMDVLVGTINMHGDVNVKRTDKIPALSGNVKFNNIDLSQLLYRKREALDKSFAVSRQTRRAEFIEKPYFDKTPISYEIFDNVAFSGNLKIDRLSYNDIIIGNFDAKIDIADKNISLNDIKADYNGGTVSGKLNLDRKNQKTGLSGSLNFQRLPVSSFDLLGKTYGVTGGTADLNFSFKTAIDSVYSIVSEMYGTLSFNILDVTVKGWSLQSIYTNLEDRDESKGLVRFVEDNINRKTTPFKSISGKFIIDKNKIVTEKETEVVMSANDYVVSANINADLDGWTFNDINTISFPTLIEMPNMLITCGGSLEKPSCSADVKAISDKYDNYLQQLANQKAQRQAAADKKVKDDLIAENDKIRPLKEELENKIIPDLQKYIAEAQKDETKAQYQIALDRANQMNETMGYLLSLEDKDKILAEDVDLARGKGDEYAKELKDLTSFSEQVREKSMREDYTIFYDRIIDVYKEAKLKVGEYRTILGKRVIEGAQLFPAVNFQEDEKFLTGRKKVEEDYVNIDNIYSKIMQEYYGTEKDLTPDKAEEYNKEIHELDDKSQEQLKIMLQDMEESLNYMKETIEKARSSDNKTESGDEAAAKAEEAQSNEKAEAVEEKAKAGDFSMKQVSGEVKGVSGSIRRLDEDGREIKPKATPQQKTSFLRAIVGEIKEITGSIKKEEK